MSVLSNLEPKSVFHYFEEISKIPHGSYNTKAISDYLKKFAEDRGLEVYQDDANNIIIIKEATEGYENSVPVIIQGHMDMVCQKEPGSDFDFEKDSLKLKIDGDFLTAEGTTLGGDDGIAVAMGLALLDDENLKHPRLELVITTDEEVGLLGAQAMDVSKLKGRRFLNIDSEEEGIFTVSCAGGTSAIAEVPVEREEVEKVLLTVKVQGLLGGHSGIAIDRERASGNIALGRSLYQINKTVDFNLVEAKGGQKDNAINSHSHAVIAVEKGDVAKVVEIVEDFAKVLQHEYRTTDPKITLLVEEGQVEKVSALTLSSTKDILFYLLLSPQGVQAMSKDIEGLVETSLNMGVLRLEEDKCVFIYAIRSSVATRVDYLVNKVTALANQIGGTVRLEGTYPGWEYRNDSPFRDLAIDIFKKQYGYEPKVEAIHAGLECGLFAGKIGPELDCLSIGPDMEGVHTPKEKLSIPSTKRVWDFVVSLIEASK